MATKTVLTYNEVAIHNCLTKRFDEETIYDPSGSDYLYTQFTITVVGFLHAQFSPSANTSSPYITPAGSGGATTQHNIISRRLSESNKRFEFSTNGGASLLLEADPSTSASKAVADVCNGPHPRLISLTKLTGDNLFRVEFTIQVCRISCARTQSESKPPILSNRWRCTDEIDANFYTTRRIEGKLILRTNPDSPHSFRHLCIPPLQQGMRREGMQFVASEDGLSLAYHFVDREVPFAAPGPATSWNMTHSESCGDGTLGFGTVEIQLAGPRDASHVEMFRIAAAIIEYKLNVGPNRTSILKELTLVDLWGDNVNGVQARATVQHVKDANVAEDQAVANVIQNVRKRLGVPVTNAIGGPLAQYDLRDSKNPGHAGAISLIGAFSSAIQSSCDSDHSFDKIKIPAKDSSSSTPSGTTPVDYVVVTSGDQVPSPTYSESHKTSPYLSYQAHSHYEYDGMKAAMPVAKTTRQDSTSGATSSGSGSTSGSASGAASGASTVVIELSPTQTRRRVRIKAERADKPPELPVPNEYTDENGIKNILMNHDIRPAAVSLSADGRRLYVVDAEFEFTLERPPTNAEKLRLPSVPWLTDSVSPKTVGENMLTLPRM